MKLLRRIERIWWKSCEALLEEARLFKYSSYRGHRISCVIEDAITDHATSRNIGYKEATNEVVDQVIKSHRFGLMDLEFMTPDDF